MQAVETPSARSPSVGYWISLALVPCVFLLVMALVDRAPQIDLALLRCQVPRRRRASRSSRRSSRRTFRPEDFAGYVDYTPVNARKHRQHLVPDRHRDICAAGRAVGRIFSDHVRRLRRPRKWLAGRPTAPLRPPYDYFRTPLYFEFPSSLLRAGVNKIEVHLVSVRYAAFMEPFYVGPARSIRPTYAYANFLQVTLVHAAIVAMLLICLLTLGLFWVRPAETGYAWFSAATFCWAAYNCAAAGTAHPDSAGGPVVLAAADCARLVLDLLGALHQSHARLRRPTAAHGKTCCSPSARSGRSPSSRIAW